jgi:FKBP-type peptidyl-prolyl cis-trans isomerase FkpA
VDGLTYNLAFSAEDPMQVPVRYGKIAQLIIVIATVSAACGSGDGMTELVTHDVQVGTGNEAVPGREVTVHYTGWLYDEAREDRKGRQFDSSRDGSSPFTFRLGSGQVIRGWDEGVAGMKVGGRRTLTIPPGYGYGSRGAGNVIPPNATLVFDVELLDVR